MLHVDTNKSLTTYPTIDETFSGLSSRFATSLSARLAEWFGVSRGITVPPMSSQWLREQDERDQKTGGLPG